MTSTLATNRRKILHRSTAIYDSLQRYERLWGESRTITRSMQDNEQEAMKTYVYTWTRREEEATVTDVRSRRDCGFDRRHARDRRLKARGQAGLGRCTISWLLDRESRSMKRARHRAVSGVVVTSINFNRYNTPHRSTPPEIVLRYRPLLPSCSASEIESNPFLHSESRIVVAICN